MKFKCSFQIPRINIAAYAKVLDQRMREALAESLLTWLDTVVMSVPVWSGASRATFLALASTIGAPVDTAGDGPFDRTFVGRSNGRGELEIDQRAGRYAFVYGTTLPWLIWNEYFNANVDPDPTKWPPPAKLRTPGPYHFQEKGARAFLSYAEGVALPAVAPFVKAYPVR